MVCPMCVWGEGAGVGVGGRVADGERAREGHGNEVGRERQGKGPVGRDGGGKRIGGEEQYGDREEGERERVKVPLQR